MVLHYVYVDSRDRDQSEDVTDFMVRLHTPIRNAIKCGVVNFTKANNSFNVHRNNNTITWVEKVPSTATANADSVVVSTITIDEGYYTATALLTAITTMMTATPGRTYAAETPVTYTYTIDADYRVSIIGTSSSSVVSNRFWGFYEEPSMFKTSLLHHVLNYQKSDVLVDTTSLDETNPVWRQSRSSLPLTTRSLTASRSYQENQPLIHICSDTLSQHSQVTHLRNGLNKTVGSNILEAIPVTVNRWSFITLHKAASTMMMHSLPNVNLDVFDIKLRNEHHQPAVGGESDFKLCILFETLDDEHEEIKTMYREFNAEAYRLAHR